MKLSSPLRRRAPIIFENFQTPLSFKTFNPAAAGGTRRSRGQRSSRSSARTCAPTPRRDASASCGRAVFGFGKYPFTDRSRTPQSEEHESNGVRVRVRHCLFSRARLRGPGAAAPPRAVSAASAPRAGRAGVGAARGRVSRGAPGVRAPTAPRARPANEPARGSGPWFVRSCCPVVAAEMAAAARARGGAVGGSVADSSHVTTDASVLDAFLYRAGDAPPQRPRALAITIIPNGPASVPECFRLVVIERISLSAHARDRRFCARGVCRARRGEHGAGRSRRPWPAHGGGKLHPPFRRAMCGLPVRRAGASDEPH